MNQTLEKIYEHFLNSTGISTDTRFLKPGALFFCLRGVNYDGNIFAKEAIKSGASKVIVDTQSGVIDAQCILVENSLLTLQKLAEYHRKQLHIPVLAITGTNGKTTTKELVARVLSKKFKTLFTQGNLNNHIGVPLTLLKINQNHTLAVIEMGANHAGEIKLLCEIAKPTYGIITNIGTAHLEGFGSPEGVLKAKTELYDWLAVNNGMAFIHSSMDDLNKAAREKGVRNIINYGKPCNDCFLDILPGIGGKLRVITKSQNKINTHLFGKYNLDNVCAALCIGQYFGIPEMDYIDAIERYIPDNQRSVILKKGTNILLIDCYNANPASMKVAITELTEHENKNKVAILGDMFELGKFSENEHENIGKLLSDNIIKTVILCGKEMIHAKKFLPGAMYFQNSSNAIDWLKEHSFNDSVILIKGSRGMQMEKIAEVIKNNQKS